MGNEILSKEDLDFVESELDKRFKYDSSFPWPAMSRLIATAKRAIELEDLIKRILDHAVIETETISYDDLDPEKLAVTNVCISPEHYELLLAALQSEETASFKPGVFYNDDLKLTEILLEDTWVAWHPWGSEFIKGHAIDCGYNESGDLVGMKVWDDVRKRPVVKSESPS